MKCRRLCINLTLHSFFFLFYIASPGRARCYRTPKKSVSFWSEFMKIGSHTSFNPDSLLKIEEYRHFELVNVQNCSSNFFILILTPFSNPHFVEFYTIIVLRCQYHCVAICTEYTSVRVVHVYNDHYCTSSTAKESLLVYDTYCKW